jgi:adenylate cyclase class 2
MLDNIIFDIDTWPNIPSYLEIEAESKQDLQKATQVIGYDWTEAVFNNARWILENKYNIPLRDLRYFTFDRVE